MQLHKVAIAKPKSKLNTKDMSLTFPHYERAKVHPQNKAVQEMILRGSNLALS